MIGPTGTVRVMVATRPVDFRKGAEGLAALAREMIQADPFNGSIYVFRAKRADRVKMVFWDGTSVCLFSKLLEDGQFRWPRLRGRRRPVAGAAATDRGRHADRDDGGSRHRLQIRRPPAVVSPSPDLRAARHSSRPLDARRLGRARRVPLAPHPRAHSRSPQVLNEAFRRRDDGAGARPWAWADENRSTLGLRARRQALGRIGPASGRLCLCAEQEVRTAHCSPASKGFSRSTVTPAIACWLRRAMSDSPFVGRMCAAGFTNWRSQAQRQSRARRSNGSRPSTPSSRTSAAAAPKSGALSARTEPAPS
jgi:hypothetical protein